MTARPAPPSAAVPPRVLSGLVLCLAGTAAAAAADRHVIPDGAGRRDGTDWANALPADRLSEAVNDLAGPGDRVLLGSGRYPNAALTIRQGGEPGRPKEIRGVDTGGGPPEWVGTWSAANPKKGPEAVRIEPGVSDVTLANLRLRGYQFGVRAKESAAAPRERLRLEDVDATEVRHHVYVSDCRDLAVIDCDAVRYSKHAFRFEGGCRGVRVARCTADCSGGDATWEEQRTEPIPFGFVVNHSEPPQADFQFEDCAAANHRMTLKPGRYPNGDGFVVERTVEGVSFLRCTAVRNRDGGFDLKPPTTMKDCVAIGNGRAYRLWATATLENCYAGDGKTGVWSNGGAVTVRGTTFYRLAGPAVMTDDKAVGGVTLTDCLIVGCGAVMKKTAKGPVTLTETVVSETPPGSATDAAVQFVPPPAGFPGGGPLPTHPSRGYRPPGGASARGTAL